MWQGIQKLNVLYVQLWCRLLSTFGKVTYMLHLLTKSHGYSIVKIIK